MGMDMSIQISNPYLYIRIRMSPTFSWEWEELKSVSDFSHCDSYLDPLYFWENWTSPSALHFIRISLHLSPTSYSFNPSIRPSHQHQLQHLQSYDDGAEIIFHSMITGGQSVVVMLLLPCDDGDEQGCESGVQKFRVKMLAESGGQSTVDVLCQVLGIYSAASFRLNCTCMLVDSKLGNAG